MNISRGKKKVAHKIVIYGPSGIGKTTLASRFPMPLFIDTEDSTSQMDVARFDRPTSWQMLLQQVKYVYDNPKCCKTLVVDSADWAEQLEIADLCARKNISGLEDLNYGKGYQYSAEEFGRFLNRLSEIVKKGINVVIVAHAHLRKVELPDEMGEFDHWEMKTSKKVGPLIKEWCDALLFCNYKTFVIQNDKGKSKAQGGKRVMYTSHHPCWDAKNRYGLPDECELSYEVIRPIIEDNSYSQKKEPERHVQDNHVSEEESWYPQDAQNEPVSDEKTTALDFNENEYKKLPRALVELMKNSNISVEKLKLAISKKGFFPENTPLENIPEDFWNMTVANWKNFEDFITEMDIQF